ncbi:hypothetical protein MUK42_16419 [Musa troglodytarum]|uniref:Secreted protein n=1 Tax=Musa troglodytarum TaxID=320322 RepID=A0A9E7I194_9LILI|nr:hypothetical protein MUK42_16419 [Musa troglodytarum]URE40121.1 hypothetical protein MUK42_16419 [Musa troglodytarum]
MQFFFFFFFFFLLMDLKVKNHSGRAPHTNARGSERHEIISTWIDGRQREEEKIDERFEYGQESPSAARAARPRRLSLQLFQHGVVPDAHLPDHVAADTSPRIASAAASTLHVAITSARHTRLADDPGFYAPRYKKHCLLLLVAMLRIFRYTALDLVEQTNSAIAQWGAELRDQKNCLDKGKWKKLLSLTEIRMEKHLLWRLGANGSWLHNGPKQSQVPKDPAPTRTELGFCYTVRAG